jgi:hypothetical protein
VTRKRLYKIFRRAFLDVFFSEVEILCIELSFYNEDLKVQANIPNNDIACSP